MDKIEELANAIYIAGPVNDPDEYVNILFKEFEKYRLADYEPGFESVSEVGVGVIRSECSKLTFTFIDKGWFFNSLTEASILKLYKISRASRLIPKQVKTWLDDKITIMAGLR